ncbi:MAG: allantoicase [Actinobacteria bacterium]|nr:allantoicase [Actinomycetota bacterium]
MTSEARTSDQPGRDHPEPEFLRLPDLASRLVGSGVVWANDELFAERENLIKPEEPSYSTYTFGHKGQIYDGWETRRRREPGHDWALVRLGLPGIVRGVLVDTAFFKGNYPPEISVEAAAVDGHPSPEELNAADWTSLVPRSPVKGHYRNAFPVHRAERFTHVRLCQYPDGGVARLRVHGEVVPDPRYLTAGAIDLAALENGGTVTGCSNMFYSSPTNLIMPGRARVMGEGWETARRRDDANDWVEIALAGPGTIRLAELDTSYFVGNAPGWASLRGHDSRSGQSPDDEVEFLSRQRLQPDTRHRFRMTGDAEVTHVRLDVYPDGGMARVRLRGDLSRSGREHLTLRWYNHLPETQVISLLTESAGLSDADSRAAAKARPAGRMADLPGKLRDMLEGSA